MGDHVDPPTGSGTAGIGQMPRVGSEFAGYRIQGLLGRGGMSVVYRADNARLGNEVALKVLSAELSENDAFRERFVRESRLAASINHPNIIPVFDAGEYDGLLFIAMRLVEGSDLKHLIREEGPLSLHRTAGLIGQAARGLDVAHQRGLVHRDIKPANVLTERAGTAAGEAVDHVYLADFGLMKHVISRSGLTDTGQFLGTVDYVAPEQIEARVPDHRADIYSLGCVVYECLTGVVPYPRDTDVAVIFAHVQDPLPRPSDVRPDLPPEVDEIAARAMAKQPEQRYQSVLELAADLARAASGSGHAPERAASQPVVASSTATRPPDPANAERKPPGRAGDPARRDGRSWLVPGLLAALVVALGVIAYQLANGDDGASPAAAPTSAPHSQPANGGDSRPTIGLEQVIPASLWGSCTPVSPILDAIETVSCTRSSDVHFEVSRFPNTAASKAAYQQYLNSRGVTPAESSCPPVWRHPTAVAGGTPPPGGHRTCFLDANGDSWIVWTHEATNMPGHPAQPDHRDVLVIASQHSQLPNKLELFFNLWSGTKKNVAGAIGKLRGT
jgi:serine/threonine protein kinase